MADCSEVRALILCAGYGTRLGDLTQEIPKPMLPLCGRPLLEYTIVHLARQGVRYIAVNLHFLPHIIRNYFGDGERWGVRLVYSTEPVLLGTAGATRPLRDFLRRGDCFLIHYGDVLTDQELAGMVACHRSRGALATMLVHQRPGSNSVATMDDAGRVIGFVERPDEEARRGLASPWVNSGLCVGCPSLLDLVEDLKAVDMARDVFPVALRTGRLYAHPLSGYRCAVDSPARLAEARSAVESGRCRIPLPVDPGASA